MTSNKIEGLIPDPEIHRETAMAIKELNQTKEDLIDSLGGTSAFLIRTTELAISMSAITVIVAKRPEKRKEVHNAILQAVVPWTFNEVRSRPHIDHDTFMRDLIIWARDFTEEKLGLKKNDPKI